MTTLVSRTLLEQQVDLTRAVLGQLHGKRRPRPIDFRGSVALSQRRVSF
ncbi:hypothetical protein JSE7799_02590 [Jannaschia seosinensis]|uniref:Uncharacterized protein n=1 Tax=Jannaschia seosinensis TaxID=313367 RepID=A0A0M7BDJ1_9RHOB|nr:hypothetical protein [Jannaschia seosinensis]CUH39862.1 hypothetical protein JSE7799_02590 [Jannaschia seosinensis]